MGTLPLIYLSKNMTIKNTLYLALLLGAIFLTGAMFFFVSTAHANPEGFIRSRPAVATSSPSYMTPGTATTTYSVDTGAGNTFAPNNVAILLTQFTASSTASVLAWRYEFSQDSSCGTNPTTADWYAYDAPITENAVGTTSPLALSSLPLENKWTFASSTPGAGAATSTGADGNTIKKAILVPLHTRCARAMFYVPVGAGNAGVWAEWVAKKEVQ